MKLSDFKYPLPRNLIAKYPAKPRDASKLMVLNRSDESLEEKRFADLVSYFSKGDCLVINQTKVFPARLFGRKEKTNAKIEVFLLRELNHDEAIWDVIVDPARKVRIGNKIYFDDGKIWCEVIDNTTSRGRTVRFNYKNDLFKIIERIGVTPLPYYINRDATEEDKETYQTVYAKIVGSVAAPTAGLHFTKRLLTQLEKKGVKIAPLILHLGLGSFRPVEVEDLSKHKMDSEYYEIPQSTVDMVNKTIDGKGSVFVAGTSTVRAIESSVTTTGHLKANRGWTDKFIFPPYDFKVVDALITNFHMPESTLLMLVSAFAGRDFVMKAYKKAIKEKWRFYSYGDAMFIQ
ncbi:MAG: tRNA preQ1(34) S-adenosylmethionine ribosyltransferase-isomerase QueA [Ignavibacteriae bacterium]|nr:tRNA preQ1(34) S-adenosylmethionine ribosyltransferase-isomerase QueA [Ignavibacteria bacterium]MBI3363635.1 tRNA preQ1(34) S-adenosylmethionine ribosyltransferase-isomerase QueA [Ignavibacteriota bacterium]